MQRTAILNVVGLTGRLIGDHTPAIRRFLERSKSAVVEPAFPAVTCTAQSTYLTGQRPDSHGIVGNGWYDRAQAEHQFWKQSNHLVKGKKLWEALREEDPSFTCAKLFWWYNMYSTVDYSITPRPLYPADGRKVFDIYTHPMPMREKIKADLGGFPFRNFWGPASNIESTKWIAESAKWTERRLSPSLSLVYLPHLDYNLQRLGTSDLGAIAGDLKEIDDVVGDLIEVYERHQVKVVLLSEYGITDVHRPIHLNRLFREQGWIQIKEELGREIFDLGASQAFAIADHQVAHVYVNDPKILTQVQDLLEKTPGVDQVLAGSTKAHAGMNHERAGDLIAVSDADSWFTYYYWQEDKFAPDFARCVDIHRKPGYDPVELFIDPEIRAPKLKILSKILKKKLGFRLLMDVIPLDAKLVRGSHGRLPNDPADWPILVGDLPSLKTNRIDATDVFSHLYAHCAAGSGYSDSAR
ncbi:MAG: putative AlkP superfamily pyrophosphatase or phosphodiesterase [Pseudoalteromonas tetraodonis]